MAGPLLETKLHVPRRRRRVVVRVAEHAGHPTKDIYAKPGVSDRWAAVRRAADLHLLSAGRDGVPDR